MPRGSKPSTYSAPTIANAKLFRLRLIVEKNAAPPGRSAAAQAATMRLGLGHVLEHLEARDGVELAGHLARELLDVDAAVVDRQAPPAAWSPRGVDVLGRQVDRDDARAARGQALGEQAAAAADVEHSPACKRSARRDVVEAQRVDVVQRAERAARIPPFGGAGCEFRELARIYVRHRYPHARSCRPQRSAAAQISATSSRSSRAVCDEMLAGDPDVGHVVP